MEFIESLAEIYNEFLYYLADIEDKEDVYAASAYVDFTMKIGLKDLEILKIWTVLLKEGLIIPRQEPYKYELTITGKLFIADGGFVKERKNHEKNRKLKDFERIAISVGTAAAGAWAIVEIYKFLQQ